MDQTKDIVLTIPAEAQYVGVVRLTVSGIANRLGFHYDDIEDIKLAVAEACTNAVDHAYKELECQGRVMVTFRIFGDRLEIRVKDEGNSLDHVDIQVGKGVVVTLTKFIQRDEVDRDVNPPAKTESHG
jgi:serine/threonine-protein kinase RsbW